MIVYANIMQAARLFDLLVCYVPRAAYANTRMQIVSVDLMRARQSRVSSSVRYRVLRSAFHSRSRRHRSISRYSTSVIDLAISRIMLHFVEIYKIFFSSRFLKFFQTLSII